MSSGMQITEAELAAMTRELDEMHHDLWPGVEAAAALAGERLREAAERAARAARIQATRRSVLRGGAIAAGVLGGGLVVAACGSESSGTSGGGTPSGTSAAEVSDLLVVRLAASLEMLAVAAYTAAIADDARVHYPPAVLNFGQTAQTQHQDHAAAWNSVLTRAGRPQQVDADPALKTTVTQQIANAQDVTDIAKLALTLETVTLATYVKDASQLQNKSTRELMLTIAPVEAQHAAILNFVIGVYPVPDSFVTTDTARSTTDLTATG